MHEGSTIRVLIVSAWDPRSGVLTIYRALAKHLGPLGVRFLAFAFDGWTADTLWTFCDELIDGRETTLAEVLMSGRYDLLQCVDSAYSPPWGIETWVRRARFRGPIVLLGAGGERVLTGPTHATRYVAVSETAAAVLAQDASRPVAAIVSGYDEEVFRPGPVEPEGRPLLVWVGRSFDPVKDVDLFLDLVELCPDYNAILVDSISEPEPGVRERLDRIGERIRHAAFLEPEQMAELYRRAGASGGAIVNTSRSEGFNCSIVEAMACECPAVAPRIPGLVHLEDGTTVVKYDRDGGAPAAAAALQRLADPALRAGVIAEGRRQAELSWTAGAMAEGYLKLYRDALEAVAASRSAGWLLDPFVRAAWRSALRIRPYWLRLPAASRGRAGRRPARVGHIRILIVSAWDPRGGVLTIYRALAKQLGPRDVRFSAFAFDGWSSDTLWTFCDELIDGRETTLAEVLMTGGYDLLHCIDSAYSRPYGVETWVRRARFRGPIVLMSQLAKRELTAPVHATRYVACSDEAARILRLDADDEVAVIPTGYDEDVFFPRAVEGYDGQRPVLVWVGRSYDAQKGADLFLDAVEALDDYDGIVVDFDPEAAAIKERLAAIGPRVRHLSLLDPPSLAELYRIAAASGGAYLSTSRLEGFPIATLEALGCGCPVVAPRIPGMSHLTDGRNAILYDPAEGLGGVRSAIDRLADSQLRAHVVEQGREDAEVQWTSGAMADAYYALYLDALGKTAPVSPIRRVVDLFARLAWRAALSVRPYWLRLRALTG